VLLCVNLAQGVGSTRDTAFNLLLDFKLLGIHILNTFLVVTASQFKLIVRYLLPGVARMILPRAARKMPLGVTNNVDLLQCCFPAYIFPVCPLHDLDLHNIFRF
jgi:hypothetical protein